VVASVLFYVPMVREMFLAAGYRDASRPVCDRILNEGKSLYIIIGGSREALETQKGRDLVYLKKRTGFVRLAIRHGVALVPCYTFNLVDMYDTAVTPFLALRRWLVSSMQICVPFFSGRFWGLTNIPYRIPLIFAVGKPLRVPRVQDPSPELVQEYLEKYIQALDQLFEERKAAAGYPPERKLHIV
jgi:hypothetical protein